MPNINLIEKFKLEADDAITYTSFWRDANNGQQNLLKAFTMKLGEIKELITEYEDIQRRLGIQHAAVRFYLGKRPKTSRRSSGNPEKEAIIGSLHNCLVMTLVDGFRTSDDGFVTDAGTDICVYAEADGTIEFGCYDFTYPCPTTCATESPLFNSDKPITVFKG